MTRLEAEVILDAYLDVLRGLEIQFDGEEQELEVGLLYKHMNMNVVLRELSR